MRDVNNMGIFYQMASDGYYDQHDMLVLFLTNNNAK